MKAAKALVFPVVLLILAEIGISLFQILAARGR